MTGFPTPPIRTLVVDDEHVARRGLALMLASDAELDVSECASGEEAVVLLRREAIDLVFLDIRMRKLDGFGVIEAIGAENMPIVVFTTAFSKHALDAFAVRAVDYLLKPISDERLASALARAKELVRLRRLGGASLQLLALLQAGPGAAPPVASIPSVPAGVRFLIRSGRSTYYVNGDVIDWVESADNYSRLWVDKRSHLVRETMHSVDQLLAKYGFMRIHRTAIVNLRRVKEIRSDVAGGLSVVLSSNERVPLSRERRSTLIEALRVFGTVAT